LTTFNNDQLREKICNQHLPGVAYIFVCGKLDEHSESYTALSQVLFDYESAKNPDEVPTRDLSDPSVRQGVFDCAMRYSDVRKAFESMFTEISAIGMKRPWWKFW
jgi:hypothetical protein